MSLLGVGLLGGNLLKWAANPNMDISIQMAHQFYISVALFATAGALMTTAIAAILIELQLSKKITKIIENIDVA